MGNLQEYSIVKLPVAHQPVMIPTPLIGKIRSGSVHWITLSCPTEVSLMWFARMMSNLLPSFVSECSKEYQMYLA